MKNDYEFIVFNDAKDFSDLTNGGEITIKYLIEQTCKRLNIKCINIPNESHRNIKNAGIRCANSMNYMLKYQIENPDKYLIIDSDMFLICDFDINEYIDFDSAIVLQRRDDNTLNYLWNGLCYFDMNKIKNIHLLNWNCRNADVGAIMHNWLEKETNGDLPNSDDLRWSNNNYDNYRIHYIKHLWSCSWDKSELPESLINNHELINFLESDPRNEKDKYFCEIYDKKFLHYRAGGNWLNEGLNLHIFLSNKLKEILIK